MLRTFIFEKINLTKHMDLSQEEWSEQLAKDENELTHAILDGIAKKTIPLESYLVSFKVDELSSQSEFKEGGFFNKQTFQKWGNTFRQRYLFAPHRIIQLLYNKTPEIMNNLAIPPVQVSDLKIEK